MTDIGLEPGQVATASGFLYIYHHEYGMCEVKNIGLDAYLATIKLQPIDSNSVATHGLRRLDFSEFERMGFAIEFLLMITPLKHHVKQGDDGQESPPLTWLVDDLEEQEEFVEDDDFSDEDADEYTPSPRRRASLQIRKRQLDPDYDSPVSEKKARQSRSTKYPCTECNMVFTNAKHLRHHASIYKHAGNEKPFICNVCGKGFRWKESCLLHNRTYHRNEPKEEEEDASPWQNRICETTLRLPMYQISPIKAFEEATTIIAFEADELSQKATQDGESKICEAVPQYCPGPSATYLVDLSKLDHPNDIIRDSYGTWGSSSNDAAFYSLDLEENTLERLNPGSKRKLASDDKPNLKVRRRSYRHPQEKRFKKTIFLGYFDEEFTVPSWAIVSYEWLCTPYDFQIKAHGNAKYNRDKPFQPTAKSVLVRLSQRATNLTPKQNVQLVAQNAEKAVGPAFVPRDNKQAHNLGHRKRLVNKDN